MLMRDSNNGQFELYDISNNQFTGFHNMGNVGLEWSVVGFGNFSGNANETDMLMRNSNNGEFELYDMSGNQFTGFHDMGNVNTSWVVVGYGDFSGNANETDMLMRNGNNGEFELFDISHNQFTGSHDMGNVGLEWSVVGFGNFSGNANETDMLMRNSNNGEFELYDISGNQFTGFHDLGNVGVAWSVNGIAVDPPSGGAGASGTEPPVSNGQGNATTLVSMSDTAAILGTGGAASFINDGGNNGSSGGPLPDPSGTSANWLTEAMYSGMSSNLADQAVLSPTLSFGSNGDAMALADNLQNVAQSAGINTSFKKL
jgi:hypothetical protein